MSSHLVPHISPPAPACRPGTHLADTGELYGPPIKQATWQPQRELSCVPRLVDAQAAQTPDAPALFADSEMVTYGELNERANKLAHYLIGLGVGVPDEKTGHVDSIVALSLDRSISGVVCALAILKAGAAYLPLDPVFPTERLAFMLNDARPRVLITTDKIARQLPAGSWPVVAVDRDAALISEQSNQSPDREIGVEQLAYVIYTSGSTGRPKGVEITHGSLNNLVAWHQQAFAVSCEDRATLLAGVGFDAAVWETWPYLASGASLHLPAEATRLAPELLRDWIISEQITISFLPTALGERVMNLEWPPQTVLRCLLTGAETLRQFPTEDLPFEVINNYGPTECTVVATSGPVPADAYTNTRPTIGRPIANTQIYILDENLHQVPVHIAGEIYVGGAGVARGYLNQPELTTAKFLRNPFSDDPDARLYRTGDLARYLANGEIAYLGRIDEQIKILGHRIEPNEIVTVLDHHPHVQGSLVVASEDGRCEKHLIAYVVLHTGLQTSAADLRTFVEQQLPTYMVPGTYVHLENFPLTQNGKVDRASLPVPDAQNTLRDEVFTAPRTLVEERLAAMLTTLLHLEQVSVNDNFFMLGGHSLLGTQLISQVRGAFGVELLLRTLFESPTIEQLAEEIERLAMAQVEAMSDEEVARRLA